MTNLSHQDVRGIDACRGKLHTAWILLAIIVLAILVRLLYSFGVERALLGLLPEEGATDNYHGIARMLLDGHGYRFRESADPTMERAPLYPLFLLAIFKLFGVNYIAVQVVQAVLAGLSCLYLFLMGRWVISSKVGLTAALMFALYPNAIEYSARLYVENVYFPVFLAFAYYLCKASFQGSTRYGAAAGFALGLCLLTRPTLLVFPLAVPFGLLVSRQHRQSIQQVASWFFPMLIVGSMVISPWVLRNHQLSGEIVPVSTWTGSPLYQGTQVSKHILEWRELKSLDTAAMRGLRQAYERALEDGTWRNISTHPEVDYDRFAKARTMDVWREDRLGVVIRSLRGLLFTWFFTYGPDLRIVSILIHLPLVLGLIGGALWMARERPDAFIRAWPALALILFLNSLHAVAYPHVRFMAPATALSFLFSAALLAYILKRVMFRPQAVQTVDA
jgi:4-amino-4-deoxy-L-arabinose transferase-like glycosyltransferase